MRPVRNYTMSYAERPGSATPNARSVRHYRRHATCNAGPLLTQGPSRVGCQVKLDGPVILAKPEETGHA
jgi:hypothetical protein